MIIEIDGSEVFLAGWLNRLTKTLVIGQGEILGPYVTDEKCK